MGKRKRQRAPGPTGFGVMWRVATEGTGMEDVGEYAAWSQRALELLPRSRTVIVPREQAEAMAVLSEDELREVVPTLRAPFEITLLDLGTVHPGTKTGEIRSVLLHQGEAIDALVCQAIGGAGVILSMPASSLDATVMPEIRPFGPKLGVDFDAPDAQAVPSMIAGLLAMLQSVNVELVETTPYPRAHRGEGLPRYEVAIRRTSRRGERREPHVDVEWSHQWEVRGHPKHFGEDTQLFAATEREHPEKILEHPERGRVVRLWCPPHVKGPEDKPLLPKVRRVTA